MDMRPFLDQLLNMCFAFLDFARTEDHCKGDAFAVKLDLLGATVHRIEAGV